MTRCKEFYEKCERDGPDWCEKTPDAVRLIENYLELCNELDRRGVQKSTTNVGLSEGAARPLFAIKDPKWRDQAISTVEKALKEKRNGNGQFTKGLTAVEVNKIIRKTNPNNNHNHVSIPTPSNILLGDFQEIGDQIPDNSVHCIITDPPYGAEYLPLYKSLGELAKRVLIPSGFLVTYSGHSYLPQVYAALGISLEYYWTAALVLKNRNLINHRNIYSTWKPISIWCKPPILPPAEYFNDLIEGEGREKDYHDWQQGESELKPFIDAFCPRNGTILDPMAGSGTTLLAAKKSSRQYIGIEVNPETFEDLKGRVLA